MADVNVGAAANDGTGDPLRAAFIKVNSTTQTLTGDLNAERTARINSIRDTGNLPLTIVGGTSNAITADIAPAVAGVTLSPLSTVELIPSATNTDKVTLNVGGAGNWPLYRRDGSELQPGDLKPGVSYLLRRRSNTWRLIGLMDSEVASASEFRQSQRRVAAHKVTISTTEISVELPAGVNPIFDKNTLIDILWPNEPWPVGPSTVIPLVVRSSSGAALYTRTARLDRETAPGPRPGGWWTIRVPDAAGQWQHVARTPSQEDVDSRARAVDVNSRFDAGFVPHRLLMATRDASVTTSLRLVLSEEPSSTERIAIVVPEDGGADGLSITTPSRTRTVGVIQPGASAFSGLAMRLWAGDVVTVQIADNSWFRLHRISAGPRTLSDFQQRLLTAEADIQFARQNTTLALRQTGGSLPARPAASRYVEWFTWSDPTAHMQPWDKWVKMPNPTVPSIPTFSDLSAFSFRQDTLNGQPYAVFTREVPEAFPQLQTINFSVNGGPWRKLKDFPYTLGEKIPITGLGPGDYELKFQFVNFLGHSEESLPRRVRVHGAQFDDNFSRQFGWGSGFQYRDNWGYRRGSAGNTPDHPLTIDSSGLARPAFANSRVYLPLAGFRDLVSPGGAGLMVGGEVYLEPGAGRSISPAIILSNGSSGIYITSNGSTWSAIKHNGGNASETLATGALATPRADAVKMRLELTPDGLFFRVYADGQLVATEPSPLISADKYEPVILAIAGGGAANTGDVYLRNFQAGKVAA